VSDILNNPLNQTRVYSQFHSPHDPCPPIRYKSYVLPPNQFIVFQPPGLPQFALQDALRLGTLWPALFSSYQSKFSQ